ncbi:MAG TPA: hypothetical protein VFT98_23135, partial [Myxococcota bacterium]|nr:hypothetical protein [Myxococcota bacterium]
MRFPITLAAGGFLTSLVFLLLWVFIHSGEPPELDTQQARRIEFTRLRRDTETASKRQSKVQRDRPD